MHYTFKMIIELRLATLPPQLASFIQPFAFSLFQYRLHLFVSWNGIGFFFNTVFSLLVFLSKWRKKRRNYFNTRPMVIIYYRLLCTQHNEWSECDRFQMQKMTGIISIVIRQIWRLCWKGRKKSRSRQQCGRGYIRIVISCNFSCTLVCIVHALEFHHPQ